MSKELKCKFSIEYDGFILTLQDSNRTYQTAVTGIEHIEYILGFFWKQQVLNCKDGETQGDFSDWLKYCNDKYPIRYTKEQDND